MRVMMLILENRIGGISIRAMEVADKLRHFNIETIFVVPSENGNLYARLQKLGFKAKQIILGRPSLKRMWANLYWVLSFPLSVAFLISIIFREKIDIVHVNGLLSLQAPIAAMITRRKIVWHLANTMYPSFLVKLLMPIISRIAFVITISESVDKYYCGTNSNTIMRKIVHEPVDFLQFSPTIFPQNFQSNYCEKLGISPHDLLVGVIGNITPVKGHEYLIQAIPFILKKIPNARFVIVGAIFDTQEAYNNNLRALIKSLDITEQVTFLGHRQDVRELLFAFDLFVLPSLFEGTPIAILEAMAMEKAVVATKVGGVPDLVVHGETGLIVNPKNFLSLAHAIIELLENKQQRINMGRKGRKRVEQFFSISQCTNSHRNIYERLYSQ